MNSGEKRRAWLRRGLVLPALLSSGAVLAQPAGDVTDGGGLQDIVVTAQRRGESLQKVPITITAVQSAELDRSQIRDLKGLERIVAGVKIPATNPAGAGKPYIRGLGFGSVFPGIESPVAVFVDDVYMFDVSLATPNLNSVERIEVLKGPQGTLYGRNTLGGVFSVKTRDPGREPGMAVDVGYANYDLFSAKVYATAPLGGTLAANVAASYEKQRDGWGRNFALGTDHQSYESGNVRAKLAADLDATTILVSGWYGEANGTQYAFGTYPDRRRDPTITLFPAGFGYYDSIANDQDSTRKAYGGSLRIEHDFGGISLVNVAAITHSNATLHADTDQTAAFIANVRQHWTTTTRTNELRLQNEGSGGIQWTAGLFLLDSDAHIQVNLIRAPTDPANLTTFSNGYLSTKSAAPFGQVTVPLAEGTRVTGGLRYNYDKRRLRTNAVNGLGTMLAQPAPVRASFKKLSWRLALEQDIGPDSLGYASYSRGYKAGTFNPGAPAGSVPPVSPETLDAFEVGLKNQFADRRIQLNLSAFYYDYKNQTVRGIVPGTARADFFNGKGSRLYGVDIDARARATDRLTLTIATAYLHSKFRSFPATVSYVDIPGRLSNRLVQPFDATGNVLPQAPRFTGSASMTYRVIDNDGFGKLELYAAANHSSTTYFEADNRLRQRPYELVDMSLTWTSTDRRWQASLWGNNLTDKRYLVEAAGSAAADIAVAGAPRTYGVTLRARFGQP
ncbi:TonB-dependent receptor [Rhizorhabdus dicambivorans]|uniref:TonB-dependent receptor n=1 Tax=Rhizorhabdus dicambivorans TaxID=1850238 RepID=A0A2A4FW86_9SPHN|nr:TonB-dependent receptor [Rhizorhabdus dicambivorans]ATE63579.1 TonB-dependent receptor [Rhizorhabdus dicambivorans]PCE42704.1 TonB-dependent receptor [Rhizorhabdus dicambivorans]